MKRSRIHMLCTLFRVYRAWCKAPHLRLGQLLVNATHHFNINLSCIEDYDL